MRPIKPSNESDNKLDAEFKRQFKNMEVAPPPGMWDTIAADLDDEREKVRYDHWYYAALLLLIPLTVVNLFFNFDLEGYYANMMDEDGGRLYSGTYRVADVYPSQVADLALNDFYYINDPMDLSFFEEEAPVVASTDGGARSRKAFVPLQFAVEPDFQGLVAATTKQRDEIVNTEPAVVRTFEEPMNLLASIGVNALPSATEPTEEQLPLAPVTNHDKVRKKVSDKEVPLKVNPLGMMRGFYIGGDMLFNHTRTFLSNGALQPLIGEDITFYRDFGYQYGLSIGYNFSPKVALEAEWIIASMQTQSFLDNRYGKLFINGEMNLTYTQVPLLVKYKVPSISNLTKLPVAFNVYGGVGFSRLKAATIRLNDERVSEEASKELFARNELGLLLGMEYDVYLHKYMFLTVGMRSSMFTDIKELKTIGGTDPRTYNFMVGVHASLNFQLPKRNKAKASPMH